MLENLTGNLIFFLRMSFCSFQASVSTTVCPSPDELLFLFYFYFYFIFFDNGDVKADFANL